MDAKRFLVAIVAVVCLPVGALAADSRDFAFNVGSVGASGLRYRVAGGAWETAEVVDGIAAVSVSYTGEPPQLEVEWEGIPFGVTSLDLGVGNADFVTEVSIGEVRYGADGASRSITLEGGGESVTIDEIFLDGIGQAFGVEQLNAMVTTELTQRMGVYIRGAVGVCLLWIIVEKGLAWFRLSLGFNANYDAAWESHRKQADLLLEGNRRAVERDAIYESETRANSEWLEDLGYEGRQRREER